MKNSFQQENETIMERYQLSMERIASIEEERSVKSPFYEYFCSAASFIQLIGELTEFIKKGGPCRAGLKELEDWNHRLYQDVLPKNYETSYLNPAFAREKLGEGYGQLLSFLYTEIRADIVYAYENRLMDITILNETFIEIYNLFEEGTPDTKEIKDVLYWFVSDYCDRTVTMRVKETLDPSMSFALDIIMEQDLTDLRYLYRFGEYISDSELSIARFMNTLPEETVKLMADTYTEGYIRGFQVMGRDLSKKKTVAVRYELGFERMVKKAVENFQAAGLKPILFRAAVESVNKNANRKSGYHSSSPNKQYDYDHRYDNALYLDKAFRDRKLAVLKVAYEEMKKEAGEFAGPAVIETFGEAGFKPVNKPEAFRLSEKQEKLSLDYANEAAQITNAYVPGDETSFTIIAFPRPQIGERFEEIFHETIAINTLDYQVYRNIQQTIIDALDQAEYVTVTGKGDNQTDLKISLHPLSQPEKQTNFENCVADVNIPLGEVFTSPVLSGTSGTLHVSSVYIGDIQFKNLKMEFADGMITGYSCENFEDHEESCKLVKQMILKNHESLPMGEFAVGTNTTAYAMAEKFGIIDKLPILIVEKMGPHFAVGDTCYSWSEDFPVYNPDGKEIIARENEVSALRKEDVSKAYFNCHTDITIPYDELDRIEAVRSDGERIAVILGGRFVLPGTEELNRAFGK